jgi:quercetin dioxygenase-like cupin family protein
MPVVAVRALLSCVSVCLASVALAAGRVAGPVQLRGPDGQVLVAYLPQQSLPEQAFDRWPGVQVRRLSGDAVSGRLAVHARFPAGWRLALAAPPAQSVEIVVLEGELQFGADALGRYDFAFVPPASPPPAIGSARGAQALLFFDPPSPDAAAVARQRERGAYVTHFDASRWQPASLAKSAGATADLRVMHLKKDPFTTARTWYVKLGGGMTTPWEVHSMVEEGYVMEGDYTLAECLPGGTVVGDYAQGGYFWRPGGIPHSGPESGTRAGVIWLQRSPVALDVAFFGGCDAGQASAPVAPAAAAAPSVALTPEAAGAARPR